MMRAFVVFALTAGAAFGQFSFTEVTAAVGLSGSYSPEAAGWEDFDCDGDYDLLLGNQNRTTTLHRNDGGTFTEVAAAVGIVHGGSGGHPGIAWGDFDGDDDPDLYICGPNGIAKLYRNDGAAFTDITAAMGVGVAATSQSVSWVDYDSDGDLDLSILATSGSHIMFRNDGASFANVSATTGITFSTGFTNAGQAWGDFDGDTDLDVVFGSFQNATQLYRNDGGTFTDVTAGSGLSNVGSVTIYWVDYDFDNDLDLHFVDYSFSRQWLFRNDGGGVFADVTAAAGITGLTNPFNCVWRDWDNDRDIDAFVDGNMNAALYENLANGTFINSLPGSGLIDYDDMHASGAADYDLDGDMDIYYARYPSNNALFRNDYSGGNGGFEVVLYNPNQLNRQAIGAKLTCFTAGREQLDYVRGGGGGHGSEHGAKMLHFGLGGFTNPDSLVVEWPDGASFTVPGGSITAGNIYSLVYPNQTGPYQPCSPVGVGNREKSQQSALTLGWRGKALHYALPKGALGRLEVYSAAGRLVTSYNGLTGLGAVSPTGLPSGVYTGRLTSGSGSVFSTFTFIR